MESVEKQNKIPRNKKNVKIKEPQTPLFIFQQLIDSQQKDLKKSQSVSNLPKLKLKDYIMLNNLITNEKRNGIIESRIYCLNKENIISKECNANDELFSVSKQSRKSGFAISKQQNKVNYSNQDILLTGEQYLQVILKKIQNQLGKAIEALRQCQKLILKKSTELKKDIHQICHYTNLSGIIQDSILNQIRKLQAAIIENPNNKLRSIETQQSDFLQQQSILTLHFGQKQQSSQSCQTQLIAQARKLGLSELQQIFRKAGQDYILERSKVKSKTGFCFRKSTIKTNDLSNNISQDKQIQ